ncbi:MAG: helix-turn-helix domain-containing protein [Lachnospiraceae bacterium]|nr:helix-turn-helix domain-containing protein [Lachnospiraceae bacterium]
MAEFGENLKRIREEKGITQQTLADRLYVTRQAVSRWEGGSRYPDLMTAKKMAKYFGVSMDELVSDDDMQEVVEKATILDSPVANKVQLVMMTLAFMCFVIMEIIEISNYTLPGVNYFSFVHTIRNLVITLVLGYGIYNTVRDKMNPKIASVLSVFYFGVAAIFTLIGIFTSSDIFPTTEIVYVLLDIVAIIVFAMYFNGKKLRSPIPVYLLVGIFTVMLIPSAISIFIQGEDLTERLLNRLINIPNLVGHILLLALLACMAGVLYRKRKQAAL